MFIMLVFLFQSFCFYSLAMEEGKKLSSGMNHETKSKPYGSRKITNKLKRKAEKKPSPEFLLELKKAGCSLEGTSKELEDVKGFADEGDNAASQDVKSMHKKYFSKPEEKEHVAVSSRTIKLFELIKSAASLTEISYEVKAGADINAIYEYTTPLNAAVRYGTSCLVRYLVSQGAHVNKPAGGDQKTLLKQAIFNESYEMVLLLLSIGADINGANGPWGTPLYEAFLRYEFNLKFCDKNKQQKMADIIWLLVNKGADIKKKSVFNIATESEQEEVIKIARGASKRYASMRIMPYTSPESILFGKN